MALLLSRARAALLPRAVVAAVRVRGGAGVPAAAAARRTMAVSATKSTAVVQHLVYQGHLRTEATHEQSGCKLLTDAPRDNQGKGESFSPTDLVGTALGSCVLTIMGITAKAGSFSVEGARVTVEKYMTTEGIRKIRLLDCTVTFPEGLTPEQKELLKDKALNCPVKVSIDGAVPMQFTFNG